MFERPDAGQLRRFIARATLIALVLGVCAQEVQASAQSQSRYQGKTYGFSIEWDSEVWDSVELDDDPVVEGVDLESVASYGTIQALPSDGIDAETCLDEMSSGFARTIDAEKSGFREASGTLIEPESIEGAATGLFTFTIDNNGREFGQVLYLSCALIDGGDSLLQIFMATNDNAYDDAVPEWEALFAGIDLTGAETVFPDSRQGERND